MPTPKTTTAEIIEEQEEKINHVYKILTGDKESEEKPYKSTGKIKSLRRTVSLQGESLEGVLCYMKDKNCSFNKALNEIIKFYCSRKEQNKGILHKFQSQLDDIHSWVEQQKEVEKLRAEYYSNR